MKIISDLPVNQKVFLLQDENFALNINKRMKAISAEHSWCACEAIGKEFTGSCSHGRLRALGRALPASWKATGRVQSLQLAGLRLQPQSQPGSNNLKM